MKAAPGKKLPIMPGQGKIGHSWLHCHHLVGQMMIPIHSHTTPWTRNRKSWEAAWWNLIQSSVFSRWVRGCGAPLEDNKAGSRNQWQGYEWTAREMWQGHSCPPFPLQSSQLGLFYLEGDEIESLFRFDCDLWIPGSSGSCNQEVSRKL